MNNHKLIERYTKLIMKMLYNVDVQVFFQEMFDNRALYRQNGLPPYIPVKEWDDSKCNITFHSRIFSKTGELPPHTWNTIVHEVSHYEEGIDEKNWRLRHSREFNNLYRRNLKKVEDLHDAFIKETNGKSNDWNNITREE
jgi:hypothetical protein